MSVLADTESQGQLDSPNYQTLIKHADRVLDPQVPSALRAPLTTRTITFHKKCRAVRWFVVVQRQFILEFCERRSIMVPA
jgi:hypothetical protein